MDYYDIEEGEREVLENALTKPIEDIDTTDQTFNSLDKTRTFVLNRNQFNALLSALNKASAWDNLEKAIADKRLAVVPCEATYEMAKAASNTIAMPEGFITNDLDIDDEKKCYKAAISTVDQNEILDNLTEGGRKDRRMNKIDLELVGIGLAVIFTLCVLCFGVYYEYSKFKAARIVIEGCER